MIRIFLYTLVLCINLMLGSIAHSAIVEGKDFSILKKPWPVRVSSERIEITEFFSYTCIHCFRFEEKLKEWLKRQNRNVILRRVHVAFSRDLIPYSKMYHTLVKLGIEPELSQKIFEEIHFNKNFLLTQEEQLDFLSRYGVDRATYLNIYNSSSVESKIQEDLFLIKNCQFNGIPTFFVQGKYETSPAMTGSADGVLKTLDFLIEKESKKEK